MTQPSTTEPSPFAQSKYQVRFDWAGSGARAVSDGADVIVWVDVLDTSDQIGPPDVATPVILGGFANRTAVARWVLDHQSAKADRFIVAVIAAGGAHHDGAPRFAVEDLLAAGAVIDALAAVGIDYCSPEAAAASAAFVGLKGAVVHLAGASGSGQQLANEGRRAEIKQAATLDSTADAPGGRQETARPQAEFSPGS